MIGVNVLNVNVWVAPIARSLVQILDVLLAIASRKNEVRVCQLLNKGGKRLLVVCPKVMGAVVGNGICLSGCLVVINPDGSNFLPPKALCCHYCVVSGNNLVGPLVYHNRLALSKLLKGSRYGLNRAHAGILLPVLELLNVNC